MRAFWLGCLCLGTMPAVAGGQYDMSDMIRPGLWEVTTQDVKSNGEMGPPETDEECITVEEVEDFTSFAKNGPDQNVRIEKFDRSDDAVSYTMAFSGTGAQESVKGSLVGDLEFDGPERYQGTMSFQMSFGGQSIESRSRVEGRRIGDCTGDEDEDDYGDEY